VDTGTCGKAAVLGDMINGTTCNYALGRYHGVEKLFSKSNSKPKSKVFFDEV
jgi:hypothetical protein